MKPLSFALLVAVCVTIAVPVSAMGPVFLPTAESLNELSPQALCSYKRYANGPYIVYLAGGDPIQTVYFPVGPYACTTCEQGVIQISSVEYASRTVNGQPCSYTVEVSIIGVTSGECPTPDESVVICPPTEVQVTVQSVLSPVLVPLPTSCCVSQDAFIRLRFLDVACGDGVPQPIFFTGAGCVSCDEYFTSLNGYPGLTDVCGVFTNNLWYRVNADCCETVKTDQETWGGVKSLYR